MSLTDSWEQPDPAPVKVAGVGVFGAHTLSFTANSKLNALVLTDYLYLMPDAAVTITSGKAWVTCDTRCNNNYLNSYQHVTLQDLKLTAKKGHAFSGTLEQVPANLFTQAIAAKSGSFDFDFIVNGHFNELKVNLKFKVIDAVVKSIQTKLGLTKLPGQAVSGVKKAGNKVLDFFKGIFKH